MVRGQGSLFQQSQEGLHGLGGPEVLVDWSSQLWLGLPGLEGLPGFRMGGGLEFMSLGVVFRVVFARDGGKVRFVGATWVG